MSDQKIKFVVKMLNEGKLSEKAAIDLVGYENILRVVNEMNNPSPPTKDPEVEKLEKANATANSEAGAYSSKNTSDKPKLTSEEHDVDTENQDTKAWDATSALARGETAPPSASQSPKTKYFGSVPDAFNTSMERSDAKDALAQYASPEEIDAVLKNVYDERQAKLKAVGQRFGVRTEEMEVTGRHTGQKHPSGLNRKDFTNRLAKRGL